MRILKGVVLSVMVLGLSAASALAADLGTYRPGTPYQTISAPAAQVCDNYCSGDARCRGWNFVKVNRDAPGICEFQSRVSDPVSSAISISGLSARSLTRPSNRIVEGATRTIRVGTDTPLERSIPTKIRRAYSNPAPKVLNTRNHPIRRASYTRPTDQRSLTQTSPPKRTTQPLVGAPVRSRPNFQPLLDSHRMAEARPVARQEVSPSHSVNQPALAAPSAVRPPQPRRMTARHQPARQPTRALTATQKLVMPPAPTRSLAMPPASYSKPASHPKTLRTSAGRPPIGQTIDAPASYPARAIVPPRSETMQRSSVNSPVGFQSSRPSDLPDSSIAQSGLYGNLFDDVTTPPPSTATRAMTTSQQRRVTPVDQEPLVSPRR